MLALLDAVRQDLRFALRQVRRAPRLTAMMVAMLGLGIGVNTALFTMVHAVTKRPAPGIPAAERLVRLRGLELRDGGAHGRELMQAEYAALAARTELFAGTAAWSAGYAAVDAGSGVQAAGVEFVTPSYFPVLGVRPALGTGLPLAAADDAPAAIAVVSDRYWRASLGGRPDVVGRTLRVNGVPVVIVGVAPSGFAGVDRIGTFSGAAQALWLPVTAQPIVAPLPGLSGQMARPPVSSVARLREGVTARQATAAAQAIVAAVDGAFERQRQLAELRVSHSIDVVPLRVANAAPESERELQMAAATGGALAVLVLLIACTNVSTLLLGRAVMRRREIGVRLSLGAGRARLVRQLLTETVGLALTAGVLGVLLLWWLAGVIQSYVPDVNVAVQWSTLLFALGFAMATGIGFGLAPALHGTRASPADVLKSGAAGATVERSRLQRGLVVAQIALTQPMLVGLGALLLLVGHEAAHRPDAAQRERVLSVAVNSWASPRLQDKGALVREELMRRFAALPGVERVSSRGSGHQLADMVVHPADRVGGVDQHAQRVRLESVGAGYFATLGVPLLRGRGIAATDVRGTADVLVIGEATARRLWGGADPIGRRLQRTNGDSTTFVVVGVASDGALEGEPTSEAAVYAAAAQQPDWFMPEMLVRTSGPAAPLTSLVRVAVADFDPQLPIRNMATLAQMDARKQRELLQISGATAAGGLLALLLASVGLYAVVAFAVGQRTREIGIRMALGASTLQVVRRFVRGGVRLSLIGLALGLPVSVVVLRLLAGSAGMATPSIPFVALATAAAVLAVAALATWLPARRAATVDPLTALRAE